MILSEQIARLIEEMLNDSDGTLEIGRNELATRMGCVPSQINYVITSRFTPQKGYIVESRRGGGGFIRITRVHLDKAQYLMHVYSAVGDSIEYDEARAFILHLMQDEIITEREAALLLSVMSERAMDTLQKETRSSVRACVLRSVILRLAAM
ncbi:Transcriptional regulator CtsR [bioreactor metagenome]|uniref:Transcriptional regulator CtsR n=1 Tax=bioreactor metagenome TaxID=1076179 RepID=A0A645B2W5_9ZZZZ|nr:CtsR family transcriptional regulator [Oscillospiraceae bacterium]